MAAPNRYWLCRPGARGHRWDYDVEIDYPGRKDALWRYHESARCERCGTIRHTFYDVYYQQLRREYIYPEGYSEAWDDQPTREQLVRYKLKYRGRDS